MKRALALVVVWCATARAEPAKLEVTHEPPPRNLKMRPRTAAAAKPEPVPAPTPAADASIKAAAREPAVELGSVRDLRRPISVRFNLGYVVDGTALTGQENLAGVKLEPYEFAQLHAYALGEGYFSSRGVGLPSLSTYFASRFQLMKSTTSLDPNAAMPKELRVSPPIANWFDRSGFDFRTGWAEVQDFLPDKRLAPLRVRAGNLYVYGPWMLHMIGTVVAWEGKLLRGTVYAGSRVPDYTRVDRLDGKNRAGIGGSSLRIDFRNLKTPIPFAISGEFLGFTEVGAADNKASNHSLIQLDWRPRKDIAVIGSARTLDGELANEHVQLRSRYKQVTNLVFDVTHRRSTDWRWDPSVPREDPLEAKRYLDLGPVVPQLLVSGRAGTLIKENIDLLLRGAYANDLVSNNIARNTFAASYVEVGGGLEVRLRRTIGLGLTGVTRQTSRQATVAMQIPDVPLVADEMPRQFGPELGEESFTELGTTVRMSLGARRFSAQVEVYGRRTHYAEVYCDASVVADCRSDLDTIRGIQSREYRGGGRATIDAWIGSRLRLLASYELSSRLDLQPEIYGFKSLRLMMEGVY